MPHRTRAQNDAPTGKRDSPISARLRSRRRERPEVYEEFDVIRKFISQALFELRALSGPLVLDALGEATIEWVEVVVEDGLPVGEVVEKFSAETESPPQIRFER